MRVVEAIEVSATPEGVWEHIADPSGYLHFLSGFTRWEVVSDEPGSCPQCGMKLLAQAAEDTVYVCPMHPDVTSETPDRCPRCGMKLVPASLVATQEHDHEHHGHEHDAHAEDEHGSHGHGHDDHGHAHAHGARRASSGKTTWSR